MSEIRVDKVSPRSGNYVSLNTVGMKNLIINGDMSIAQRGTSQASITTSDYHTVDRWKTSISSLGTWTQTQSTDVPTGQGFANSTKLDCTTADASPSASDVMFFQQAIEGQNLQYLKFGTSNAQQLTLSFWVKTNKTGTYICEMINNDSSTSVSKSYTINSANTWEKKTINIPADTSNGFDNDNASSLRIYFWLGAGSDYTSGTLNTNWNSFTNANRVVGQVNLADSTSNEWYITGVQLEAGEVASDFEFLPVDVNLQRCQRYFYSNEVITGTTYWMDTYTSATGYIISLLSFPVTMRIRATMSYSGNWISSNTTTSSPSFVTFSEQGYKMQARATNSARTFIYPDGAGTLTAAAEL